MQKRAFLEIEFKEEMGTGLGPTLEFYSLISQEIKNKKELWRPMTDNTLFPAPLSMQLLNQEDIQKAYEFFRVMGVMMAKSIVDDRLIDLPVSPVWWDIILGKVF